MNIIPSCTERLDSCDATIALLLLVLHTPKLLTTDKSNPSHCSSPAQLGQPPLNQSAGGSAQPARRERPWSCAPLHRLSPFEVHRSTCRRPGRRGRPPAMRSVVSL